MKRIAIIAFLIVLAIVAGLFLFQEDDEVQIDRIIKQGATSVERRDLAKSLKDISLKYKDDRGFSYFTLKDLLRRFYSNTSEIDIDIEDVKINIKNGRATVDIRLSVMAIISGNPRYIIGGTMARDTIRIFLEKKGFDWVIVRVGEIRLRASPF